MKGDLPTIVISDANVLIDYCLSNPEILRLVTAHLWSVMVPLPVFNEVKQLKEESAKDLGLVIVDPELRDLAESAGRQGRLSQPDRLCFVMARRHGWGCWTNDTNLRRVCETEAISVYWGLEAMLHLTQRGCLTHVQAVRTARKIHEVNSKHVNEDILARFIQKLEDQKGET